MCIWKHVNVWNTLFPLVTNRKQSRPSPTRGLCLDHSLENVVEHISSFGALKHEKMSGCSPYMMTPRSLIKAAMRLTSWICQYNSWFLIHWNPSTYICIYIYIPRFPCWSSDKSLIRMPTRAFAAGFIRTVRLRSVGHTHLFALHVKVKSVRQWTGSLSICVFMCFHFFSYDFRVNVQVQQAKSQTDNFWASIPKPATELQTIYDISKAESSWCESTVKRSAKLMTLRCGIVWVHFICQFMCWIISKYRFIFLIFLFTKLAACPGTNKRIVL